MFCQGVSFTGTKLVFLNLVNGNKLQKKKGVCLLSFEVSSDFHVSRVQAKATADLFAAAGTGSSSVHVRADGKDAVKLNAQISHTFQGGARAVGLKVNVSQSLLPSATDMHVNMAANVSSDRSVHPPLFHHTIYGMPF